MRCGDIEIRALVPLLDATDAPPCKAVCVALVQETTSDTRRERDSNIDDASEDAYWIGCS